MDRSVRLWRLAAEPSLEAEVFVYEAGALCLAIHPDGTRLAAGAHDGTIHLWEIGHAEHLLVLRAAGAAITRVRFSDDGMQLIAGDAKGQLWIWETRDSVTSNTSPISFIVKPSS